MTPENEPLWYDHAEPEEPLDIYARILIGTFAVGEFLCVGLVGVWQIFKGGAVMAFRDLKS